LPVIDLGINTFMEERQTAEEYLFSPSPQGEGKLKFVVSNLFSSHNFSLHSGHFDNSFPLVCDEVLD
jgi:hypothetical protein